MQQPYDVHVVSDNNGIQINYKDSGAQQWYTEKVQGDHNQGDHQQQPSHDHMQVTPATAPKYSSSFRSAPKYSQSQHSQQSQRSYSYEPASSEQWNLVSAMAPRKCCPNVSIKTPFKVFFSEPGLVDEYLATNENVFENTWVDYMHEEEEWEYNRYPYGDEKLPGVTWKDGHFHQPRVCLLKLREEFWEGLENSRFKKPRDEKTITKRLDRVRYNPASNVGGELNSWRRYTLNKPIPVDIAKSDECILDLKLTGGYPPLEYDTCYALVLLHTSNAKDDLISPFWTERNPNQTAPRKSASESAGAPPAYGNGSQSQSSHTPDGTHSKRGALLDAINQRKDLPMNTGLKRPQVPQEDRRKSHSPGFYTLSTTAEEETPTKVEPKTPTTKQEAVSTPNGEKACCTIL